MRFGEWLYAMEMSVVKVAISIGGTIENIHKATVE
jgi:hypothetical protein